MRIVQIAGEYPPLQGGLGDYTRELSRALAALGHELHVLTKMSPGLPQHEEAAGITIHRLSPRWGWHTLGQLNAFIAEHQPDIINLQYQTAAYQMHGAINLVPRFVGKRAPVVVTFHDLRAPYLFPKAGPLRRRSILELAHSAAAVIVTNEEDCAMLALASLSNVSMIPIGSNIAPPHSMAALSTDFDRLAWLQAHSYPRSDYVVGYFGFMNASKGGAVLVRGLAALRALGVDANLLLIGGLTGESDHTNIAYANEVLALAEQLGVRDHILQTGFVNDHQVSEALTACDCMALPYIDGASFRRGTLMAALAHGRAIVTTMPRVPLPEMRDGENLLLVPPQDETALANTIARVLRDAPLRQRLEAGSAALSRLFSWDGIATKTARVYTSLLP